MISIDHLHFITFQNLTIEIQEQAKTMWKEFREMIMQQDQMDFAKSTVRIYIFAAVNQPFSYP